MREFFPQAWINQPSFDEGFALHSPRGALTFAKALEIWGQKSLIQFREYVFDLRDDVLILFYSLEEIDIQYFVSKLCQEAVLRGVCWNKMCLTSPLRVLMITRY